MRVTKTQAKAYFNTGDIPTETEFSDLIDSIYGDEYNVRDYGAVGDGVTDDILAFEACQNDMPAQGGVFRIPTGNFLLSRTFYINKAINMQGSGRGYFYANPLGAYRLTRISTTHPSTPAIVLEFGTNITFTISSLSLCYIGTTPSSGNTAIRITGGGIHFIMRDIGVRDYYDGVRIEDGSPEYLIDNLIVIGPFRYGLYLNELHNPDFGDQCISNCVFRAYTRMPSGAAIKFEGGGGVKIMNCKVNSSENNAGFANAIDINNIAGPTSDFLVTNCSLENMRLEAIKITGTSLIRQILISNTQIGYYAVPTASTPAITVSTPADAIAFSNLIIYNDFSGGFTPVYPAIKLTGISMGKVTGIVIRGYTVDVEKVSSDGVTVL